jgi:hypothetical protein
MLESGNHDTNGMFPQLAGSIANLCAVPADLKVAMISTPGMVAQEARATLKTISKAVRGIKRKLKREEAPVTERCTDNIIFQAAVIQHIHGQTATTKWFLLWHGRSGYFGSPVRPCSEDETEVATIQELSHSPHIVELLRRPGDVSVHQAVRWLAEWFTFQWLVQLNVRGIAPTSADVREEFARHVPPPLRPHVAEVLDGLSDSTNYQRRWAETFRHRWGLHFKKLAVGHTLSDLEIRERAPL